VVAYNLEFARAPEFSWERSHRALPDLGAAVGSL
jgi:hypothetical protein